MAEQSIPKETGINKSSAENSATKESNLAKFSYRKEEQSSGLYDRSGRFFCRKGSWFFKTREGIDYGPYQSRVECRYAYEEFIDVVSGASNLNFGKQTTEYQDAKSDWNLPKINFN
ncbi:MAG: hypothetical protein COA86_13160 [Kangiella sp.]|nr:MAG: hypothetical protein COA86_13160 [Kangiella sp.]